MYQHTPQRGPQHRPGENAIILAMVAATLVVASVRIPQFADAHAARAAQAVAMKTGRAG